MMDVARVDGFESSWALLDEGFRACLSEAWTGLQSRGLPVGAAISAGSAIAARGRNRVYDAVGGTDPLQQTPIAHAEMNAIASVDGDTDLSECALWTTHTLCKMCAAAIELSGIPTVHVLAADPSDETSDYSAGGRNDVWSFIANVFFLHNIAWVGGRDNPIVARNLRTEPEVTSLALSLLSDEALIDGLGDGMGKALTEFWESFSRGASRRAERLGL